MTKRLNKRSFILPNKYAWGGWKKLGILNDEGKIANSAGGIANTVASGISGIINSSGNTTGVGSALLGIGSLASNIPGVGGLVGAGVNLAGGLFNSAFGSNLNEDFIAQTEDKIKQQSAYTSAAKDNASLLSDWANYRDLANVSRSDVGSDGWFSNKAKNKAKELNRQIDAANLQAIASLNNTMSNVDTTNDLLALSNFSAYGGPINMRYTGAMSPFGNLFKDGGGIHIKPSKRGTFTAAAKKHGKSVQGFASLVLANKENYSPAMVKKANFVRNAAKWHDEGGPLFDWNNLKKDNYGLLTYNGTPILSPEDSGRGTSKNKSIRRDTPVGYLVGDKGLSTANLIWGGLELLPVVGNVMGIADVVNDVYNMANSDNVSSGDFGNLLLDIGGLVPGISTFTKASKLAKGLKLSKVASKLDNAAESLKYTSSDGIKEIKKRVKDAKDFSKRASEEAIKAALSRNKEDLYKASMRAREAAKFNEGILNGVERTLDPFWSKYNVYLNVGTKADALNDIFGFTGAIEDNVKALGGELTHGGIFSNGLISIDNGGTHEQNPFLGVLIGADEQGIPNLVELGETIYNDYVFSDRIRVPKAIRQKYKLRDNITFSDAVKHLSKESKDRPNDPISQNGLKSILSDLANTQELIRMKKEDNKFAEGGKLGNLFSGLGDSPNTLIPDWLWYNNLLLNNENRIASDYMILNNNGTVDWSKTYAPDSRFSKLRNFYILNWDNPNFKQYKDEYLSLLSSHNKNMDLSKFTLDDFKRITSDKKWGYGHELRNVSSLVGSLKPEESPAKPDFSKTTQIKNTYILPVTLQADLPDITKVSGIRLNPLRYAPIVGSGLSVLSDIFGGNEPDYSNADLFGRAINNANRPIGTRPIGEYLRYLPLDRMFYINLLNASNMASRRAALNISGGNRAAALAGVLAADYNYGNQLGDLARKAEEYNQGLRERVADFNRKTDMFNSELGTRVDMFNSELAGKQASLYGQLASMRQGILEKNRAEKIANMTNFIQGLGDLGRELTDRDTLRWLSDIGALPYNPKGEYVGGRYTAAPSNEGRNGGKIKRKKGLVI